jgi:hypothetical protein
LVAVLRVAWVGALVLLGGCTGAAGRGASPEHLEIVGRTDDGRTRLELRRGSAGAAVVMIARDATVEPAAEPSGIDVIGEVPGVAVAVADRYPSTPGGLYFCQAGDERFLRVLSLAGAPAQTMSLKVASCRDNLELSEPGLEWVAATSMLSVHWLTGPSGAPEVRTFQIGSDGAAHTVSAP